MTKPNRTRSGKTILVVTAVAASLLSCQGRLADLDEDERGYRWCVTVNAARVLDDQGNNAGTVLDEDKVTAPKSASSTERRPSFLSARQRNERRREPMSRHSSSEGTPTSRQDRSSFSVPDEKTR